MNFRWAFLLAACMLFTGHAAAITVTDRWPSDLNVITHVSEDGVNHVLTIEEDYNEDNKIPYPSHDGYAVVDWDAGEDLHWFDKIFDTTGATGAWQFDFVVDNTTPWKWSDYHFVFFTDDTFTTTLDMTNILLGWSNTVIFQNSALDADGDELSFWAPSKHMPGAVHTYSILLDLDQLPDTFGIRQIATTPAPGTLVLWTMGLLAGGYASRRKS